MRRRKLSFAGALQFVISLLLLGGGLAGFILLLLSQQRPATRDNSSLIPEVQTYIADEFRGELDLDVNGMVVPYREITVAAEVSGRIAEKSKDFQAGSYVSQGTELLKIDSREYDLEVRRLNAEIEQAERMLAETAQELVGAEERREIAEREYQLQQNEYQRRSRLEGALSETELNQSRQNMLTFEAALQMAQNNVMTLQKRRSRMESAIELTKLQAERAALDLQRTSIVAPADGVVVSEDVEEGDFVQRGEQLLLFEDTQKAEVRCNLTLSQLRWIFDNSPGSWLINAEATSAAYRLPRCEVTVYSVNDPQMAWRGTLERFDGIGLDERTKTFPCRIVVDDPITEGPLGQRALVRGSYVRCRIVIPADQMQNQGKQFVRFPEVAVQPGGYVWLNRDGKLARQDIEIVDRAESETPEGMIEFVVVQVSGTSLQLGDRVIVSPLAMPVDNAEVREVDVNAEPAATVEAAATDETTPVSTKDHSASDGARP